jgi:hypothetical protein
MLAILSVAIIFLAVGTGGYMPIVIVVLLGTVYGALQAVCRLLFAALVPPDEPAELFGFNAIAGRVSAAAGPLVFSAVRSLSGSESVALLSLLVFLAAGAAMLGSLRIPAAQSRGIRHANSAEAEFHEPGGLEGLEQAVELLMRNPDHGGQLGLRDVQRLRFRCLPVAMLQVDGFGEP